MTAEADCRGPTAPGEPDVSGGSEVVGAGLEAGGVDGLGSLDGECVGGLPVACPLGEGDDGSVWTGVDAGDGDLVGSVVRVGDGSSDGEPSGVGDDVRVGAGTTAAGGVAASGGLTNRYSTKTATKTPNSAHVVRRGR